MLTFLIILSSCFLVPLPRLGTLAGLTQLKKRVSGSGADREEAELIVSPLLFCVCHLWFSGKIFSQKIRRLRWLKAAQGAAFEKLPVFLATHKVNALFLERPFLYLKFN